MFYKNLLIVLTIFFSSLNQLSQQSFREYIRKNSNQLTHREWQSYRRGVEVLKQRSRANKYDPTGFDYQVNLHGWLGYDGTPEADQMAQRLNWHTCQHSHYWFLVWHRMYLYFYERILRKASNDPTLTLPYWDHYSPGKSRSMPEAFRIPADESLNPLYMKSGRCSGINRGLPLKGEVTDVSGALKSTFFTVDPEVSELNVCHSFGGGRVDRPVFVSQYGGLLDLDPHMMVHAYIGGPGGVMSDVCQSARDPIFMPHHSQMDRVWESWLRLGGLNPIDRQFLDQTFDFFDENGQRVSARVRHFANISNLYSYDEYIGGQRVRPLHRIPETFIDMKVHNLSLSYTKPSIVANLRPETVRLFDELAKDSQRLSNIRFTLQLFVQSMEPSVYFDIYLNLNPESLPYNQSPNYINSMVIFDNNCVSLTQKSQNIETKGIINFCFDVTKQLQQIVKNDYNLNGFVSNQLNITFVGRDCNDNYIMNWTSNIILSFSSAVLVHIFN